MIKITTKRQHALLLREILKKVKRNYRTETETVTQISSYLGNVHLTEFVGYHFTIGIYRNANHSHFLMMNKTIEEIKNDLVPGKKNIKPKVIFIIKFGNNEKIYTRVQSGSITPINLNGMSHEFFEAFMRLQKLLHKL